MIRAFQWDLARQAERLEWLVRQLPRYADWGYQEVYLHLEDAVEFPSQPGVARKDAYSQRELERLVAAAGKVGIAVVPIVNLLGHTQYLIKVPELRELNELVDGAGRALEHGQICPLHPRTLEVAAGLIGDVAWACTAGKVHVGLDESYHLGKHPLSAAEVREVGLAGHFGRYVRRLEGVARGEGLRMGMWADMLALVPGAIRHLPAGIVAYDWYYYPFRRRPAVELHNFKEYELAPALKRQGVEYWGCPMSGPFRWEPMPTFGDRLGNARSWWERCRRVGAAGMLVTSWEPSTVAAPVVQAVDAAIAGWWLDAPAVQSGNNDNKSILARGFRRAFGVGARAALAMAAAALAADRHAYAGYFRWEIGQDWNNGLARGDGAALRAEAKFFKNLARKARAWPQPFADSLRFRAYLAERDAFVVNCRTRRRLPLREGRDVARRMWRCTRDLADGGPNVARVRRDGEQLRDFRRVAAETNQVFRCQVRNFAPALQQLVLQRRADAGEWEDVRARFAMEFTAAGARRHAGKLAHPFGAGIGDGEGTFRLAVRGVGELAVFGLECVCSGGMRHYARARKESTIRLGAPAPASGFPALDWIRPGGRTLTFTMADFE